MTFLFTLPSTVPSSAFATALSLPIVTGVRKGQSVRRVEKDGYKESQHLPRVVFGEGDGDGVPGPASASGLS